MTQLFSYLLTQRRTACHAHIGLWRRQEVKPREVVGFVKHVGFKPGVTERGSYG